MSGNRAIYERAMEQNREAARQNRWDDAKKSAVRALQEFPQDTDARTAVAVSLFHTKQLDKALKVFVELRSADPHNPFFIEYIARTQEGHGNIEAAITTYRELADLHQKRRASARTITALREILRLRPDLDDERKRLAELLYETNATREAATEYLTLARRYRDRGLLDEAASSTETSLQLDPHSREAKELLSVLHDSMAQAAGVATQERAPVSNYSGGTQGFRQGTSSLRSQTFQMEKIVAQAVSLQDAGDTEGAIKEYKRAVQMGTDRADVFYSLGLLYQERNELQAAVKMLLKATNDPEYALSAHYSLGGCYKDLNDLPKAAQEYEQAIRLVDLETIGKAESEDLIQMYEDVVGIYQKMGDFARAASLYSTLASFLQGKRWGKDRAVEFNKRAKELTQQTLMDKMRNIGTGMLGPPATSATPPPEEEDIPETWGKIRPITDFLREGKITTGSLNAPAEQTPITDPLEGIDSLPALEEPAFAPVTPLNTDGIDDLLKRWVQASEKYIEQGLLEAALDACHEIIRLNIDYLPIHMRIGEIFERMGRTRDALTKYQILVDTLMVRDEIETAIKVYFRIIEISPDVTNMRSRLAELLKRVGRVEEAAEQLGQVAAIYFRLGQTNKALEEYRRVLQWAPKSKDLHDHYGLALFKLERYESALGEFRKSLDLEANDPATIARINMTLAAMGEQPNMVWDSFATLLEKCKADSQICSTVQAEYRAALLVSDAPILHYLLAILQQYSNQHTSALMELEQTLSILELEEDPMLPQVLVHQAMADSHIALGEAEKALEQLRLGQKVAEHAKPNPSIKHAFAKPLSQGDLIRRMAEAYAASDDMEGAEKALLEAQSLLPYDRSIYTKLADVYFRQGKLSEAIAQLDDLATHYEERQYLDQAIETLQDALKLAPNNIHVGDRLARLHIRRGYPDKGVEGLLRVADLQKRAGQLKDAVASLQQAAEIYWMQSKHEEVRVIYDKIVTIAPNDIEARQWLAIMHTLAFRTSEAIAEKKQIVRLFTEKQDYDNAIAELHQIIGLNQQDLESYYILGDLLMRRGEYAQSVQLYKRMLKMDGVEKERVEALLAASNRMLEQQKESR